MRCDSCEDVIDPQTDRHLFTRERFVAPQISTEDIVAQSTLCEECMDPTFATLTQVQERLNDRGA